MSVRAPLLSCAIVLALLLPLAFLDGDDTGSAGDVETAPLETIARRVERLRVLRFRRIPHAQPVSPAMARREGLADLARSYPVARRLADEETLKLLGLIEPDVDLREVTASLFGDDVAGYYDPRTDRLRIVRGAATSSRVLAEMTLAHELTHALEDQTFGLRTGDLEQTDDEALAYLALVEGSATAVMLEYVDEHFNAGEALGGLLPALSANAAPLPPFLEAQLTFPYLRGARFVEALYRAADRQWTLVGAAHRFRRPASTEQILHPRAYLADERPVRVGLSADRTLGAGWQRVSAGTLGEFQTGELLALAGEGGAAGWGGDRYELWRDGALDPSDCPAPCVARDALVMRWAWDDGSGLRRFAERLRDYVAGALDARPAGAGRWARAGGGIALSEAGGAVTLAFAPSPALAARLARDA